MQEARKHFSKLGLMYFIGTLIIFAVQLSALKACSVFKPEWLEDTSIYLFVAMLPMYLIAMPIMMALIKKMPGSHIEQHTMKPGQIALMAIMCYSVMYISNLIGVLITFIIGLFKNSAVENGMVSLATSTNVWTNVIIMVIAAPFIEEYVFRKLLIERTVRYGQGVAVLLSGLMFGLFHGNLNQFVYAFSLGIFFGFIYVKTGKLRYTIGLHMFINFMGSVAGTLMLKLINYEEFAQATLGGASPETIMALYMDSLPGWIAFMLYVVLVIAMTITGFVLLIVFRKRFTFTAGEEVIAKGARFKTVIFNVGMMLYIVFWLAMIIRQLVM